MSLKKISSWFRKPDDGYDPNGKSELDGQEHSARFEIRAAVLADPLSESTRKTRRSLLALSVLALVVNARLPIEKLPYIGSSPSEDSMVALLGVIAIGLVYFLVNFIVSVGYEYLRWREDGNLTVIRQIHNWVQKIHEKVREVNEHQKNAESRQTSSFVTKVSQEALEILPELKKRIRRTENYYVSTTRVQMFRMAIVEIALPFIVAIIALEKVIAHVWPMAVRIIAA